MYASTLLTSRVIRSGRGLLLALTLVALLLTTVLTGSTSAATRDDDAASLTTEATATTAGDGSGNELVGDVDVFDTYIYVGW